MRTVPAPPTLVLLLGVLVTLLTACDGDLRADSDHEPSARSSIPQTAGPAPSAPRAAEVDTARADDPYVGVGRLLHGHGVRIWWESDLVARWLEGPASFEGAIRRLGMLARQPGTAGIKVADEIGYHDGLGTPARAMAFLRATRAALTRVAPGKPILVDAVVLELGCMPRTAEVMACEARARADAPAATISAMTSYLNAHLIDRLDLSTGLEDPAPYPDHSLSEAQDLAWTYVAAGPWPRLTALQSRKALAEPGGFSGGADGAAAAARTYIDVPRV
ncbi:MAG: hypothetical protein JOZ82_12120, partial [Marmoricola sp.]|nr:hypothetical protein [Marmoricola sp.]